MGEWDGGSALGMEPCACSLCLLFLGKHFPLNTFYVYNTMYFLGSRAAALCMLALGICLYAWLLCGVCC